MELDVVALALLTAAAWGASSPVTKLGLERGGTPFQASLTIVSVSVVVYWGALLVRGESLVDHPAWVLALFAFTGLLATAVARVVTYTGVDRVGASVNSAGVNTRPVWAMLLAVAFLGETVTLQTGIGVVVVVVGLIALALSEGGDVTGWRLHDLAFPIGAAMAFAVGNVIRRFALSTTDVTSLEAVAINETAGFIGLAAYIVAFRADDVRGFLSAPRRAYGFFLGSGLLGALALFTLFEALSRGRVVVVDPLSSPTSLFAILFTFLFLREVEQVTRRLVVGGVLVVTGVVLITGPQVLAL